MGAVAKGVLESWNQKPHKKHKPIEGVTTTDYLKRYDTEKELAAIADIVVSKTLEERKRHMLEAEFVIFTPGGVGTLDELAFDCVAMQDGLLQKKPFVLFNTDGFFHHLLEFLKDIHLKGFADFVPFIVVDNVYEASVAFDMIRYRYSLKKSKNINMEETIERIEYDLPYVLQEKQKNPQKTTRQILNEIKHTFSGQGEPFPCSFTRRHTQVRLTPRFCLTACKTIPRRWAESRERNTTAVAAQVGTGNIVGASAAILLGGPGAIFWMWIIAFFGMATIYSEAVLAQKTRIVHEDGHGRVAAFEVLHTNPAVRNLIREGKTHQLTSVMQTNRKAGMITMDDALLQLYAQHSISKDQVLQFAQDQESMKMKLM